MHPLNSRMETQSIMKLVLECGAHDGSPQRLESTRLLRSGKYKGILLEPYQPRFKLLLKRWCAGHICLPVGLSDVDAPSETFRTHRADHGLDFFGQSVTWDTLVETNGYYIDTAIIDVEHMELKVLAGMTKRLPQRLQIEMHVPGVREAVEEKGFVFQRLSGAINQDGHFYLKGGVYDV